MSRKHNPDGARFCGIALARNLPGRRVWIAASVLALLLLSGGCAAPRAGEPDPQPEDDHAFHTTQEHYGRAGAIPERRGSQTQPADER
jgi:hypothetical protein